MIKYAKIEGYDNLGPASVFSHFYQFMEQGKETPMTILVHAYECDAQIFKGYLFDKTKTFRSVPLSLNELKIIEGCTGKAEQVNFQEFVHGTLLKDHYKEYKEAN